MRTQPDADINADAGDLIGASVNDIVSADDGADAVLVSPLNTASQ